MENRYLYIVFSSTPYRVGKMIRKFTREAYNHVSIALDGDLNQMYGFARRYYHTPLYGGFVKESTSRYHFNGQTAQVRICRLPVTGAQYQQISTRLHTMHAQKEQYLYNYLSVFVAPFRRLVPVKNAYICVEFCARLLQEISFPVERRKYYSVGDLEALLRPYAVYSGPIPDTHGLDEAYYAEKPIPHPIWTSLRSFLALFPRLGN